MSLRLNLARMALTLWVAMLMANALYVFVDRKGALARWFRMQEASVERGSFDGGPGLTVEPTGVAALGIDMYAGAVLGLAIGALVLALAWRAFHRPEGRVLAVFLAFLMGPGIVLEWLGLPQATYLTLLTGLAAVPAAAFVRFAAVFPTPLEPGDLDPAARKMRPLQAAALRPRWVWGAAAVLGAALTASAVVGGPLTALLSALLIVPILVGVSLLRRSYRIADAGERRRLLWVVQGFYTAAWVLLLGVGAGIVLAATEGARAAMSGSDAMQGVSLLAINLAVELGMLVLLVSLATAIFYHGALEPGLVIQKTTVYGLLTAFGAATFGVVENFVSGIVLDSLALPASWGGPIAGAVVAGGVTLLRPRLGVWAARRFPGPVAVTPAQPG